MSTAIVTGAGRGIGRGIALRLARDGHTVAVNDMWDLIDEKLGTYLGLAKGQTLALAGPDSDYMTGQSVMIDGGIVMA